MIPPKTIQDILEAARIEEVVGEFVTLRRRGVNLIGLCPFHGEKTPSFNVNPTRNIFKCFGCGKAGDPVTFLREHESMSFEDAIRWLGKKYRIEIEEVARTPEQLAEQQLADSLFILNEFAQKHFTEQLLNTDEGKSVALSYFKKRGLRDDTIQRFGLGYAPDNWDLLIQKAKQKGHSLSLLQKVGLCNAEATRDFFRARVIFTIHNLSGKVAAFAGRTLSSEKSIPKYINSPETAVYVKNKTLYGAFQARNAIRKLDECILVEGYMDVISLSQAGIENVVASSGTSLTDGQLQLIKRNTSNLTILYDGDAAGVKAALRGLDLALEQDLNVRIALLPDGHDPDTFVQEKGADALRDFIQSESKDFILFKTHLLLEETKGDPIKKAALIKDIVGSIAKIPDPIKRSLYQKECSVLMNVDENALVQELNRIIGGTLKKQAEKANKSGQAASDLPADPYAEGFPSSTDVGFPPPQPPHTDKKSIHERDIARLLIQFGASTLEQGETVASYVLHDLEDALGSFEHPLYAKVALETLRMLQLEQPYTTQAFLQHPDEAIRKLSIDLLTEPWEYSSNWDHKVGYPLQNQPMPELNFEADMRYSVDAFKISKLRKMCEETNPARIREASAENNLEKLTDLLLLQQKIKETLNKIAHLRNIVVFPK